MVNERAWIHFTSKWLIFTENLGSLPPEPNICNLWALRAFWMNGWYNEQKGGSILNRTRPWSSNESVLRRKDNLKGYPQMEIMQLTGHQTWGISFEIAFAPTLSCFQVCWLKFHPTSKILQTIHTCNYLLRVHVLYILIWWEMAHGCLVHHCVPRV